MARDIPTIICDSSALISITDSCFIHAMYHLRRSLKAQFVIPQSVVYECVEHPRRVRAHATYALRMARAIQDRVFTVVDLESEEESKQIMDLANHSFYVGERPLELLQAGEAECLALAIETGVDDILVDERTTRALIESPDEFRAHLTEEFGSSLRSNMENLETLLSICHSLRFCRSTEIMMLAYEKGYFNDYGPMKEEALEAGLYRLKYSGCAITESEIEESLKIEDALRR